MARRRRKHRNPDPMTTLALIAAGGAIVVGGAYVYRRRKAMRTISPADGGGGGGGGNGGLKPYVPTEPTIPKAYVQIQGCPDEPCVVSSDPHVSSLLGEGMIAVEVGSLPVDVVVSVSNDFDPPTVQTSAGTALVGGQSGKTRDFIFRISKQALSTAPEDFNALVSVTFQSLNFQGEPQWNNRAFRIYV